MKHELSLQIIVTMVMSILAIGTLLYFISLNAVGIRYVNYAYDHSYYMFHGSRRGLNAMVRETKL